MASRRSSYTAVAAAAADCLRAMSFKMVCDPMYNTNASNKLTTGITSMACCNPTARAASFIGPPAAACFAK